MERKQHINVKQLINIQIKKKTNQKSYQQTRLTSQKEKKPKQTKKPHNSKNQNKKIPQITNEQRVVENLSAIANKKQQEKRWGDKKACEWHWPYYLEIIYFLPMYSPGWRNSTLDINSIDAEQECVLIKLFVWGDSEIRVKHWRQEPWTPGQTVCELITVCWLVRTEVWYPPFLHRASLCFCSIGLLMEGNLN